MGTGPRTKIGGSIGENISARPTATRRAALTNPPPWRYPFEQVMRIDPLDEQQEFLRRKAGRSAPAVPPIDRCALHPVLGIAVAAPSRSNRSPALFPRTAKNGDAAGLVTMQPSCGRQLPLELVEGGAIAAQKQSLGGTAHAE